MREERLRDMDGSHYHLLLTGRWVEPFRATGNKTGLPTFLVQPQNRKYQRIRVRKQKRHGKPKKARKQENKAVWGIGRKRRDKERWRLSHRASSSYRGLNKAKASCPWKTSNYQNSEVECECKLEDGVDVSSRECEKNSKSLHLNV